MQKAMADPTCGGTQCQLLAKAFPQVHNVLGGGGLATAWASSQDAYRSCGSLHHRLLLSL